MKYVCEDTTLKNISLYTESTTGDLVPPREVVNNLCPADCSGHGMCKNRTCICEKGFTALDCSMEVNAVPELLGIYNGGLCDIRERPCKKTNLLGENFINSKNLTCHVKEVKVFPGSWSPRGIPVTSNGKMTDLFGVKCSLPEPPTKLGDYEHEGTPAGGLLISVSNDGFNASVQQLRHLSYDSKCIICSKSGKCILKPNSCLIKGHCFAANEPNPRDWCLQCLPHTDQNSWTRRKNNQVPKFTSKSTYYAIQWENVMVQLKATDPDNRPVTYSILSSTATGYTFSRSGLLRWKVTSNENKRFTFKVTDECGAFNTIDMTVRIVQCPCLYGGKCIPHPYHPRGSGLYQCKCVNGNSGARCEEFMAISGEDIPDAAPIITSIAPVRYDTMKITWLPIPEHQRNGIIRGYKIYYKEEYTKQKWNVFTTPTGELTSTMVTGLKSYTEYCVKISALTSKGEYPFWERKQCNRLKTPSLLINVSGEAKSRTEILLKFVKPKRSVASDRIQVDYGKQKNHLNLQKACYTSSCIVDNLEEDTLYFFKVIGYVYQKGESPSFIQIRTLSRGSKSAKRP